MSIQIFPDRQSLIDGTAEYITRIAVEAIARRKRFTVALSGGSTPRPVYSRLATEPFLHQIDWSRVHVFFGDERCVPPDDPRSNFKMAQDALFEHVPLVPSNIHRMHGEDPPEKAAAAYAAVLEKTLGGKSGSGAPADPIDLVLLGMGDNGHTASLFPGIPELLDEKRWVVAKYIEEVVMWRVTMTPVLINSARNVAFLVSGADKAEMAAKILEGPYQPVQLPSQIVKPTNGDLRWLLDAPAATLLKAPV
jgi:6-phosphogluconolactonase